MKPVWIGAAVAGVTLVAVTAASWMRTPTVRGAVVEVRQSGRAFEPGTVVIKRDDTVTFVNDDGDLTHHAYLSDDKFSFDTGDQAPGSRTPVTFPIAGTFQVLCGIHPKMHLSVVVR